MEWFSGGKKILNIKYVLHFLYNFCQEKFLILRRIQWDITINAHMSSCKVPVILVRFYQTWTFSTDFRKILKYQLSRNPWVGAEFFHVDRSTDGHHDANSRFSQFCEMGPKNGKNHSKNTCTLL